ncbi:UNVERIFIED_CONTAM: hypothetical protein FKN15_020029 [Acipenser sinensis]
MQNGDLLMTLDVKTGIGGPHGDCFEEELVTMLSGSMKGVASVTCSCPNGQFMPGCSLLSFVQKWNSTHNRYVSHVRKQIPSVANPRYVLDRGQVKVGLVESYRTHLHNREISSETVWLMLHNMIQDGSQLAAAVNVFGAVTSSSHGIQHSLAHVQSNTLCALRLNEAKDVVNISGNATPKAGTVLALIAVPAVLSVPNLQSSPGVTLKLVFYRGNRRVVEHFIRKLCEHRTSLTVTNKTQAFDRRWTAACLHLAVFGSAAMWHVLKEDWRLLPLRFTSTERGDPVDA